MGTIFFKISRKPDFVVAEPDSKLISDEIPIVTPLGLVVTSTGFSPVYGSAAISSIIFVAAL